MLPLARALAVFNAADRQMSGLCRTEQRPSVSTTGAKVLVDGMAEFFGEELFVLKFPPARKPE